MKRLLIPFFKKMVSETACYFPFKKIGHESGSIMPVVKNLVTHLSELYPIEWTIKKVTFYRVFYVIIEKYQRGTRNNYA